MNIFGEEGLVFVDFMLIFLQSEYTSGTSVNWELLKNRTLSSHKWPDNVVLFPFPTLPKHP